jgi:hypothetical protein
VKEKAGDDDDGSSNGVLITEVVEEVLADEPRPGTPVTFGPEQVVVWIVALACEDPRDCGRPVTHWTPRSLLMKPKNGASLRASHLAAWGVFE